MGWSDCWSDRTRQFEGVTLGLTHQTENTRLHVIFFFFCCFFHTAAGAVERLWVVCNYCGAGTRHNDRCVMCEWMWVLVRVFTKYCLQFFIAATLWSAANIYRVALFTRGHRTGYEIEKTDTDWSVFFYKSDVRNRIWMWKCFAIWCLCYTTEIYGNECRQQAGRFNSDAVSLLHTHTLSQIYNNLI